MDVGAARVRFRWVARLEGAAPMNVMPWLDLSVSRERRLEAALVAIRDETPHKGDVTTYCPACLAEVALAAGRETERS